MEKDCLTCKYFTLFKKGYCDGLESDTQGFCHCDKSPYYSDKGAGEGKKCEYYKKDHYVTVYDINHSINRSASSLSGNPEFWESVDKSQNQNSQNIQTKQHTWEESLKNITIHITCPKCNSTEFVEHEYTQQVFCKKCNKEIMKPESGTIQLESI